MIEKRDLQRAWVGVGHFANRVLARTIAVWPQPGSLIPRAGDVAPWCRLTLSRF